MCKHREIAPAKINLALDVLHKRADGYHEVEMIMTSISLNDTLTLRKRGDNRIVIKSNCNELPHDKKNLIYKAVVKIRELHHISKGVTITLEKNIPIGAGLGGGSSNAAATLRGLDKLWKLNCTIDELAKIGATIGSDVPFCVYGGTALATGRGEQVCPLPQIPHCCIIIVNAGLYVSTPSIYKKLQLQNIKHPEIDVVANAIKQQNYDLMCGHMGNVLETVTLELHPKLKKIKNIMKNYGVDRTLMSGSGSAIFGLFSKQKNIAELTEDLEQNGFTVYKTFPELPHLSHRS